MQVPPFSLREQLDHLGEELDAAVLQVLRSGQYIGGGVIAFDYGARTSRFGAGLDEIEASQAVTAIQKRCRIRDSTMR